MYRCFRAILPAIAVSKETGQASEVLVDRWQGSLRSKKHRLSKQLPLLVRETRKLEVPSSSPYTSHAVFTVIAGRLLGKPLRKFRLQECLRYHHIWKPRGRRKPRLCPKCKNVFWDRPTRDIIVARKRFTLRER